MFGKNRTRNWKGNIAALLAGGTFILNTTAVFAAPVELTLDDAIALALKNNLDITIMGTARDSAFWAINQAKTGKKVSVEYDFTGSRSDSSASITKPTNSFSHSITATLPLYTGGTAEAGIKQAELALKVSDWEVARSKQQVKLDATTGYFDILQARNVLKVDQESVDQLSAHLKNVQAQYSVGTVAKSDVLQSQVKLANAQQTLISQKNTYDVAVSSLNNVLGLPLDAELELKEELAYVKYDISLEDSIKKALANRPEIIEADINIESAKQGVIGAQGNKKPTVALSGKVGLFDDQLPGTEDNNWLIAVKANWSVFDSGLNNSKIKQKSAALSKAEYTAKQTKDNVTLSVRQAYLNMAAAEKNIDTAKVAVEQAEEDFKIAQVRYSSGVGTNLDVMDAELSLTQAKTNYIKTLYEYNTSKAKLDKAMGVAVK
jgi:outer membrane protein TolC